MIIFLRQPCSRISAHRAAARVGQADEVAHGAPLKEADEARVINSPVHAAEDERVHISEGFNGALHRLRNRSDRVVDEFDAAVFADRLHAVLNAAEILYRRDDGFIADAEAPCGGCGKADILFVVPTLSLSLEAAAARISPSSAPPSEQTLMTVGITSEKSKYLSRSC